MEHCYCTLAEHKILHGFDSKLSKVEIRKVCLKGLDWIKAKTGDLQGMEAADKRILTRCHAAIQLR